jgi:hypothetical protein
MKNKTLAAVLLALVLGVSALGAYARTLVPIINYENESWSRPDNKALTADQVTQAIRAAIVEHKAEGKYPWEVEPRSDGKLMAKVIVRDKHIVRVLITPTATTFSAVYFSSSDMKAGKDAAGAEVIHPFYNRWAGDLVKAIKAKLSKA